MNWYVAKIVFRITSGEGNHTPQFDEQLRLISAADKKEALEKARQIGHHEQDSFVNEKKQLVKWQFINIPELTILPSLTDGIEIYSRVNEYDNAKRYIETVHKKAEYVRSAFHKNLTGVL